MNYEFMYLVVEVVGVVMFGVVFCFGVVIVGYGVSFVYVDRSVV